MKASVALISLLMSANAAQACDWRCTAAWFNSDPATRMTADGPNLAAYGQAGASGAEAVSRCKLDVAYAVTEPAKREKFQKKCYDLYRADVREDMRAVDARVGTSPSRVDIHINIERENDNAPLYQDPACARDWRCGRLDPNRNLLDDQHRPHYRHEGRRGLERHSR